VDRPPPALSFARFHKAISFVEIVSKSLAYIRAYSIVGHCDLPTSVELLLRRFTVCRFAVLVLLDDAEGHHSENCGEQN
jgi:hypothetical protein